MVVSLLEPIHEQAPGLFHFNSYFSSVPICCVLISDSIKMGFHLLLFNNLEELKHS